MLPILFTLSLFFQQPEPLALDELYFDDVGFSHQLEENVLFSTFSGMSVPLHHFSFETGKVTEIKDGRINAMLPFIFSQDDRFVLLNAIGNLTLFYLSKQGQFIEKLPLSLDLDPGERVMAAIPGKSYVWLSLHSKERSCLAQLSLKDHKITRMPCISDSEHPKKVWFEFQEQLYMLTSDTGELREVTEHYIRGEVVFRGIEPVLNTVSRRQKYFHPLTQPVVVFPDFVSFAARNLRTSYGEEVEDKSLIGATLDTNIKLTKSPFRIIAKYKDQTLSINCPNKELEIISQK
jgi:hypothetical protein